MFARGTCADRALSLLEVLLAIGLAAVALLSLMLVLIGGLQLMERSQDLAEATGVGRELMERILARNYSFDPSNTIFDGRVPTAPSSGFPPAPYPSATLKYVYTTRVQVDSLDAYRNRVQVDVFWDAGRSLHLESITTR